MEKLSVEQFSEILDPAGLNEGSIFGALSEDATRFLLDNGLIFSVAAGEVVFSAGDSGDSFADCCTTGECHKLDAFVGDQWFHDSRNVTDKNA